MAAGNVAIEEVVFLAQELGIETGIDLDALIDAALLAEKTIGRSLNGRLMHGGSLSAIAAATERVPTMAYETVSVDIDARVATLTFIGSTSITPMNTQWWTICTPLGGLGGDSAVRVIVTTGAGEKLAGGDLGLMRAQADSDRAGRMAEARHFALMLRSRPNAQTGGGARQRSGPMAAASV